MKWSVILVIVASLSFIAAARAESALEYGSYCRPYEKPEMRGDRVYVTPNYEIGLCWGAFAGMQTLFSMTSGGKAYAPRVRSTGEYSRSVDTNFSSLS